LAIFDILQIFAPTVAPPLGAECESRFKSLSSTVLVLPK
jgi:hypothetical protein